MIAWWIQFLAGFFGAFALAALILLAGNLLAKGCNWVAGKLGR